MATQGRTPIPKTQREISVSQHTATDPQMGNPNSSFTSINTNRALNTSFKGDTVKPFSVGIQDIDEAILYYFTEVIQPFVIQNGQRLSVPVLYASPEKWKSAQKDGYYRDAKGAPMYPLIIFKRDTINRDRTIANKLDANDPNLFQVFTKKYSTKDAYSNFNVLNNRTPQKTYYAAIMPDYVTIEYSCTIFTYYVEQLNKIVEAINYASDAYWGDPQRFKFQARIDSFNTISELADNAERAVKSTFTIKLHGYLVPNVLQKDMKAIKKFTDKTKVIFSLEVSSNDAILRGTVNADGTATELKQKEAQRKVQLDQNTSRATIIP
jgi:hypothetical protein